MKLKIKYNQEHVKIFIEFIYKYEPTNNKKFQNKLLTLVLKLIIYYTPLHQFIR